MKTYRCLFSLTKVACFGCGVIMQMEEHRGDGKVDKFLYFDYVRFGVNIRDLRHSARLQIKLNYSHGRFACIQSYEVKINTKKNADTLKNLKSPWVRFCTHEELNKSRLLHLRRAWRRALLFGRKLIWNLNWLIDLRGILSNTHTNSPNAKNDNFPKTLNDLQNDSEWNHFWRIA